MSQSRILCSGMRLPPLPTIRDLVKLYKLQAIKQLSQNFLMDERLTDRIVKSAGRIDPVDTVLEVGPGPGGITRSILRRQPQRLVVVERDARFAPALELLRDCARPLGIAMDIYHADILRFDLAAHVPPPPQQQQSLFTDDSAVMPRLHLIGNLPFAISTRLLINWLSDLSMRRGAFAGSGAPTTSMTLTFQQEVAQRICAPLGSEDHRCRLSVMSQIWTEPALKFTIPGRAFVPKPDVDVGVVRLRPLARPKTELPFALVERVVRHIFSMRQKYCRRGYSTLLPPHVRDAVTTELFYAADVDDKLRPFQLSVDECLRLATVYAQYVAEHPTVGEYDYRGPKQVVNAVTDFD